ncbi:alginate lyase [Roseinatronobacter thiooxidans]|uniref:Alginate lyase n=1 Tax=Roseinatronobacter thiooxidans TaxID=121821 RepID=A0A2W7PWY2_9RHOB|nr:alginate lyase family protein [Roseinatronobacter thiooxidans]PZX38330.1 alginate lyase [Roseinatronobacter thiooxidans]
MSARDTIDPVEALAKNIRSLWKENAVLRNTLMAMQMEIYELRQQSLPVVSPDSFAFFRIIGNDLPPRHQIGQSLSNIRFILDNEPPQAGVIRRWVLNRISDPHTEASIIDLLTSRGEVFDRIVFDPEVYRQIGWNTAPLQFGAKPFYSPALADNKVTTLSAFQNRELLYDTAYHDKIRYVANNNGARNCCLETGRALARWVMPWDGNCFMTESGWAQIRAAITARPDLPYIVVPMARITHNESLFDPALQPDLQEEPQIIFRNDAREIFDPTLRYGRRPKVELLSRLRVPGPWDKWPKAAWEPAPTVSADAGLYQHAGWVARLSSGAHALEIAGASSRRGVARSHGIRGLIDRIDDAQIGAVLTNLPTKALDWWTLLDQRNRYHAGDEGLDTLITGALLPAAREALGRGPYSVLDKKGCAPSGEPRDYWHPAPYHWPNSDSPTGLPYLKHDGQRVPGTQFGDPEAVNYDRTSLQAVFDDTLTLALAAFFSGEACFGDHAVALLKQWFVAEESRMTPNLVYAQLIPGETTSRGRGIIEAKDIYYFLDAVGLLDHLGAISPDIMAVFRFWLTTYLDWLRTSPQGLSERASANNHGTAYDLQIAAIAAFLGRGRLVQEASLMSCQRIYAQFDDTGAQPQEIIRSTSKHYCHFNLQLWAALADIYRSCGIDLWQFEASPGRGIVAAISYLATQLREPAWPGKQIDVFDCRRSHVLLLRGHANGGAALCSPVMTYARAETFDPHSAIRPWWRLGTVTAL